MQQAGDQEGQEESGQEESRQKEKSQKVSQRQNNISAIGSESDKPGASENRRLLDSGPIVFSSPFRSYLIVPTVFPQSNATEHCIRPVSALLFEFHPGR